MDSVIRLRSAYVTLRSGEVLVVLGTSDVQRLSNHSRLNRDIQYLTRADRRTVSERERCLVVKFAQVARPLFACCVMVIRQIVCVDTAPVARANAALDCLEVLFADC